MWILLQNIFISRAQKRGEVVEMIRGKDVDPSQRVADQPTRLVSGENGVKLAKKQGDVFLLNILYDCRFYRLIGCTVPGDELWNSKLINILT